MISIPSILAEMGRPAPYQGGAELWRDPHIAGEMLKCHLSPDTDAASYRPDAIRAICERLPARMGLAPGARVVDLGCGPGLYCHRLAQAGYEMVGVDWSENSLRHARALCAGQRALFRGQSYLEPFGEQEFDGALMIFQDYGVLSPESRRTFLQNVHRALRGGGVFALDVPSHAALAALRQRASSSWQANEGGFWRPHAHVVLAATHFYPDIFVACDLYAVLDDEVTVYRNWQTYFSPDSLRGELRAGGFEAQDMMSGLLGEPWREESPVLAVICTKA